MFLLGESHIFYFTSLENHSLFTIIDNDGLPHQFFIPRDFTSDILIKKELCLIITNQCEPFHFCKLYSEPDRWIVKFFNDYGIMVFCAPFNETCEYY